MNFEYQPSEQDVFFNPHDPSKKLSQPESQTRLREFYTQFIQYFDQIHHLLKQKGPLPSAAEQGAKMGKLFLEYAETAPNELAAIANTKMLLEGTAKKRSQILGREVSANHLLSGFYGEYAAGTMLLDLNGKPIYGSEEADRFEATDWRVAVPTSTTEKEIHVQVKTISLKQDRESMGDKALPVLASVHTLEDLNLYIEKLRGLTTELSFVGKGETDEEIKSETLTPDILKNLNQYELRVIPNPNITPNGQAGRETRIGEITKAAIRLHRVAQRPDQEFYPVMCVLGSPDSNGSDINTISAHVSPDTLFQARQEFDEIRDKIP
jgi:hypothetical protein